MSSGSPASSMSDRHAHVIGVATIQRGEHRNCIEH
jgi:hypothetical protein